MGGDGISDHVGARLRAVRSDRNLLQEDVARHLGVSVSTISRLENRARGQALDHLMALADLYGLGLEDLVGASGRASLTGDSEPTTFEVLRCNPAHTLGTLIRVNLPPSVTETDDWGSAFARHVHPELIIVLVGTLRIETQFGLDYDFVAGERLRVNSGVRHRLANASRSRPMEFLLWTSEHASAPREHRWADDVVTFTEDALQDRCATTTANQPIKSVDPVQRAPFDWPEIVGLSGTEQRALDNHLGKPPFGPPPFSADLEIPDTPDGQ